MFFLGLFEWMGEIWRARTVNATSTKKVKQKKCKRNANEEMYERTNNERKWIGMPYHQFIIHKNKATCTYTRVMVTHSFML